MGHAQVWRINAPDVISETIDGETIILHLGNGFYFSVGGCGPTVWSLLSTSVPVDQVREQISAQFDVGGADIDAELDRFIDDLESEGLIVSTEGSLAATAPTMEAVAQKAAFVAPTVEKFTDMEDLLLLDPVHEVSPEKGWPHAAPTAVSGPGA